MNAVALQTPYHLFNQPFTIDTNISLLCVAPTRQTTLPEMLGRLLMALSDAERRVLSISQAAMSGDCCVVIGGTLTDQEVVRLQAALPNVRLCVQNNVALISSPSEYPLIACLAQSAINVLAFVQESQTVSAIVEQRDLNRFEPY